MLFFRECKDRFYFGYTIYDLYFFDQGPNINKPALGDGNQD